MGIKYRIKIILNSDEDYDNAFLEIFKEAVKCRLRSAFPIGFELSGGFDSSSVVSIAKYILNNKIFYKTYINTFSMILIISRMTKVNISKVYK